MDYSNNRITYVFSSDLYKCKFLEKLEYNRQEINASLTNRFGFAISNDILCDIKMYLTIEKRGFLIFVNGDEMRSPDDFMLIGDTIVKKEKKADISSALEKIETLKDSGVITDDEYEMMKMRILA